MTLDRHIEITPDVRGGQPHLRGSRITVADLVLMHLRLGQSLPEIAGKYHLPLATVYAGIAYIMTTGPRLTSALKQIWLLPRHFGTIIFPRFRKS